LMSYISLVDLGINQAIARFLVDHKDRRSEGKYGALIKTSALVSAVQGLIVLGVVMAGSPLLAGLMKIPAEYQATFVVLMRIQGVIAAFNFCMNPLAIMLNAHQRSDLVSRQSIYSMALQLGLLVLFLVKGCGIYAFVYAGAIMSVVMPSQMFWHCRRLGFWPSAGEWGKISWPQFKEVCLYGKDVFLMGVGAQLITTSQTIIISRALGLEAAAAWSVGTKVFMLVRQIVFQPYSAATAGLCEMVARNETVQLRCRFQNLVVLIASLGVFLGTTFALCNSLFVEVWTGGKIVWAPLNDVLLAVWLFVSALQCTHCNFVTVTKQIGGMRYLYFLEGCSFITLVLGLGYRWNLPGIIVCSIVCTMLFSYPYALWRSRQHFQLGYFNLVIVWVRPAYTLAGLLIPAGVTIWLGTSELPAIWRLLIHGIAATLGGGFLFLRFGLPSEMIRDGIARVPRSVMRILEIFGPRALKYFGI